MKNLDYITCEYVEEMLKEELSSPKEKKQFAL